MDTSGHTLLHSAAKSNDLEAAELLLREEVDIYLKDKDGLTSLHILIQKRMEMFDSLHAKEMEEYSSTLISVKDSKALEKADAKNETHPNKYLYEYRKRDQERHEQFKQDKEDSLNVIRNSIEENERFIKMLIKHKSAVCSKEDIKLLKLYSACLLSDSSVADIFSNNLTNFQQAIDKNSSWYPGYTALHFASHWNANIVRILVKKGANLLTEDTKGITPLSICTKTFNVAQMHTILSAGPEWKNILFSDGKTKLLDYISSLNYPDTHRQFLQHLGKDISIFLPKNSPLWPGFTLAHIAVTLLPESNLQIIQDILNAHSDIVTIQDNHGSTPIHLAFLQNKLKILDILFKKHKKAINPSDKDNLTHLHIAAVVNNSTLPKKIVKKEENLDVVYNGRSLSSVKTSWTPLHVAAYTKHAAVARILFEGGANLYQTDYQGFTPIHLLFGRNNTENLSKIFLAPDQLKERIAKKCGLTHLHVAVWKDKPEAINQLLDMGSKIEATIGQLEDEELKKFEGYRPLHIAMMGTYTHSYEILLQRGADIFAKKLDGSSPLSRVLTGKYDGNFLKPMIKLIWTSETLQKRIDEEMGITKLHLACYALDLAKVEEELGLEHADINARIRDNSSIWPGFTPLHVLIFANMQSGLRIDQLLTLLLDKGADINLMDAEGNSSVLMALKTRYITIDGGLYVNVIIKRQTDFKINPMNKFGMSHFHVACYLNNEEIVDKFFEAIPDIDVNQAIDHSDTSKFAGHTPLLLALCPRVKSHYDAKSQIETVKLLLKHGAKIHAVDAFGYTPLHKLVACDARNVLLQKILIDDADINKPANDGKTPMEILLSADATVKEVKYLVNKGSQLNSYNRVSGAGYMATCLGSRYVMSYAILRYMLDLLDVSEVTDTGRNAIHNAVAYSSEGSNEYRKDEIIDVIKKLVKLGCDISQQDSQGRTPLHLATKFQNYVAIEALLISGADVNIVDSHKKTAFYNASQVRVEKRTYYRAVDFNESTIKVLAIHLKNLELVGMQVSGLNAKVLKKVLREKEDIVTKFDSKKNVLIQELEDASKIKMCGLGFTLRDFLYATGPVNLYSSLKKNDRDAVDSQFEPTNLAKFPNLEGFLRLQYKNALQRPSLKATAIQAFWKLVGFILPNLCVDEVFMYLTNFDLKNTISAVDINSDERMIVD